MNWIQWNTDIFYAILFCIITSFCFYLPWKVFALSAKKHPAFVFICYRLIPLGFHYLDILDVYLARIDSHDPEKRTVIIEKGELERVLCVTRILKDDLNKRLRNLFQIVEIEDATKPDGFKIIQLASEDVVNLPEAPTTEQSQHKYIALKVAEIKRRNQEKNL